MRTMPPTPIPPMKLSSNEWTAPRCGLTFSCTELHLFPQKDEIAEGSFAIYSEPDRITEGYVSCREERMQCLTPYFSGSAESIAYRFDTTGMREGEIRSGHFLILSDQGEYELPYRVKIARRTVMSGQTPIENLFQFATLARNSWSEAVELFYSPDFLRLFSGSDRKYRNLYKGLSKYVGNERNVEEFLVSAQQKPPVDFFLPASEMVLSFHPARLQEEQIAETVRISRNGWGYTRLTAEADGAFLHIEKRILREEDFIGNQCTFSVFIDPKQLHDGKNFGRIILRSAEDAGKESKTWEIRVTAVRERENRFARSGRRMEMKRLMVELIRLYQDYKLKKISAADWQAGSAGTVERMRRLDEHSPEVRLYQVQLLLTENRMEEAERILKSLNVTPKGNGPEIYSYFLYLSSLCNPAENETSRALLEIEELHRRFPDSWRIAWLLGYLTPALRRSPARKWEFLAEQFERRGTSPVLYAEALQMANQMPSLLSKLERYELQILQFGVKHDCLSEDLCRHVVYLADKEKYYSEVLFSVLKACYEKKPDRETVHAICSLLIKGNKTGPEYLQWYRRGVDQELRVTRLYEYYMMSADPDGEEEIPRNVLMYFAYQSNLEAEQSALLYAYVLKNREKIPELYLAYRGQMERFILQQLEKGRIGKKLAFLYSDMSENGMLTPDRAQLLAPLLFRQQLDCRSEDICQAVVIHTRLRGEQCYPVENGKTFVDLYDRDYEIFLEDDRQNRYSVGRTYDITALIHPAGCEKEMRLWVNRSLGFDLYCCESSKGIVTVTEENADRFRNLADAEEVLPAFARAIRMALLQYYDQKEEIKELDLLLERLEREELDGANLPEAAELLVRRSFYEKAYRWMAGVDPEKVSESILLRLCSRMLESGQYAEEKRMQELAVSAFLRGKYDSRILEYLSQFMTGSTEELLSVRTASENFELDVYPITQRLLIQLLFVRDDVMNRIDLFRFFVTEGGRSDVEAAFLHRCSGLFLMEGRTMHPYVLADIARMAERGEAVSDMCKLSYLQYYASHREERNAGTDAVIRRFGEEMIRRDIKLPLFREYADLLDGAETLLDKTMIVFRGEREHPVTIHYRVNRIGEDCGATEPYAVSSLEMQHLYAGIYTANFVLFAGESLQYYITRSADGYLGRKLDGGELRMGEITGEMKQSRYGRINDIAAHWLMGEKDAAQELLEQYLCTEWMLDGLFGEEGNGR